ncbi:helix-turn-helix domain-containing protein [Staphylococcus epidermidis]|nr:helix-turn-helix domain-containing protein [Staphylococcus epidermidis]
MQLCNRTVNLLEQGESISHIAKINGISRPTVYKIKEQYLKK